MPDQVQDAFKEAIFSLDESDRKGAEKFVKSMLEEKRLQMETWSKKSGIIFLVGGESKKTGIFSPKL